MKRGHEINQRARALGIFSDREFERATARVGLRVPRASIAKATDDQASDQIYGRLEIALDRLEGETPGAPTTIELDRTAEMILALLRKTLTEEPPAPNPGEDDLHTTQLRAMKYYEWERHVSAVRLMLSTRLVTLALEQD